MKYVSVQERLAEIQAIMARATFEESDSTEIIQLRINDCPKWEDYIGKSLKQGMVLQYGDKKILTMQYIATVLEIYPPMSVGTEALYQIYTDETGKEWIYNEYVEIGWQRTYNGDTYTVIQKPTANIYTPNLSPNVWRKQEFDI